MITTTSAKGHSSNSLSICLRAMPRNTTLLDQYQALPLRFFAFLYSHLNDIKKYCKRLRYSSFKIYSTLTTIHSVKESFSHLEIFLPVFDAMEIFSPVFNAMEIFSLVFDTMEIFSPVLDEEYVSVGLNYLVRQVAELQTTVTIGKRSSYNFN